MPSSSGLYDDSDGEAEANVLSPTDGYFNGRPAPSFDSLVRDPQQEERTARAESDKAREAREESEASASASAAAAAAAQARREPQAIVRSPVSRRFLPDWQDDDDDDERDTERTPLIPPHSSAPPAYADATAGSSSQHSAPPPTSRPGAHGERNNYHTAARGPIFLPDNGQPEDLGGESPPDHGKSPLGKSWWEWPWARFRPKHLVLMAATICALGFIISALMRIVTVVHGSPHQLPIGDYPLPYPSSCSAARHHMEGAFPFGNSDTFHFVQSFADYDSHEPSRQVRSTGEIHVFPTVRLAGSLVQANVQMHYSDDAIMTNTVWYKKLDRLQLNLVTALAIKTPNIAAKPCVHTIVHIYVSPSAPMSFFELATSAFSVTIHNGLYLDADRLAITTTSGNVAFPTEPGNASALNARNIVVDSTSGSITGGYRLLDLLKVTTHSGSINVDIEPCAVSVEEPKPAQLILHTISGSIAARTPAMFLGADGTSSSVPPRDYKNSVSSSSGSIRASLIHGSRTSLGAASGRIEATLAPYGFVKARSEIDVSSHSGSIETTVLPSLSDAGEPMRCLWSAYRYTSGSLRLTYPSDWEGRIEGTTISGSISVDWPGVEVIEGGSPDGHVGFTRLKARKGKGDGEIQFNGISGSTTIRGPSDDGGRRYEHGGGRDAGHGDGRWWGGGDVPKPRWPGYDDEWALLMEPGRAALPRGEVSWTVVEE